MIGVIYIKNLVNSDLCLLLLKQLQQYNSQNRLNDRGKQFLARLMSFMNQPLPGRNRDI